jgi:hypothetical protein
MTENRISLPQLLKYKGKEKWQKVITKTKLFVQILQTQFANNCTLICKGIHSSITKHILLGIRILRYSISNSGC